MSSSAPSKPSTVPVALIQADLIWHDAQGNRDLLEDMFPAVAPECELVVLPEMFTSGFTMAPAEVAETMSGATVAWMRAQARALAAVVCGSVVIAVDGSFRNRFIWATPSGDLSYYDKRHCFRMAGEHEHYQPGGTAEVMSLQDAAGTTVARCLPQVCYDLRFPVFSRNVIDSADITTAADGYDISIYVASWPAARQAHWRALLAARAIENQAIVIGVNRVGVDGNDVNYVGGSVVFDGNGEVIVEAGAAAGVIQAHLDLAQLAAYRAAFPAWLDRDDFTLAGP